MPIIEKKMKPREIATLERFNSVIKASEVLKLFFDKGFTSVVALRAIVNHYYPEITYQKLIEFWNFRTCDAELIEKISLVLEKLNHE
jgi:hypothetical protein